jgi:hypothetical protein
VLIVGPDFLVTARLRSDGVIAVVDRAMRYLEGRRIESVLELAEKRGWKISFNDAEQKQLAVGANGAPVGPVVTDIARG